MCNSRCGEIWRVLVLEEAAKEVQYAQRSIDLHDILIMPCTLPPEASVVQGMRRSVHHCCKPLGRTEGRNNRLAVEEKRSRHGTSSESALYGTSVCALLQPHAIAALLRL